MKGLYMRARQEGWRRFVRGGGKGGEIRIGLCWTEGWASEEGAVCVCVLVECVEARGVECGENFMLAGEWKGQKNARK